MKNLSSYCLTPEQKVLLCQIINNFGSDQHPFANNDTLPYFTVEYVKELLQSEEVQNARVNLTKAGERIFNELETKFLN